MLPAPSSRGSWFKGQDFRIYPKDDCFEKDWISNLNDRFSKNVKVTLVQALRLCTGLTAHSGSRGIALLLHDHGNRRGWGVSVTPRPLFTLGKTQYPLYRRLGGPQGRSGQLRKISPPPGFDPRTVQPVASRYTDYGTRTTTCLVASFKYFREILKKVVKIRKMTFPYGSLPLLFFSRIAKQLKVT